MILSKAYHYPLLILKSKQYPNPCHEKDRICEKNETRGRVLVDSVEIITDHGNCLVSRYKDDPHICDMLDVIERLDPEQRCRFFIQKCMETNHEYCKDVMRRSKETLKSDEEPSAKIKHLTEIEGELNQAISMLHTEISYLKKNISESDECSEISRNNRMAIFELETYERRIMDRYNEIHSLNTSNINNNSYNLNQVMKFFSIYGIIVAVIGIVVGFAAEMLKDSLDTRTTAIVLVSGFGVVLAILVIAAWKKWTRYDYIPIENERVARSQPFQSIRRCFRRGHD